MNVAQGFAEKIKANLANRLTDLDAFSEAVLRRAELAVEAAASIYVANLAGVAPERLQLEVDALEARMAAIKAAGSIRLASEISSAIRDIREAAWQGVFGNLSGIDEVNDAEDAATSATVELPPPS